MKPKKFNKEKSFVYRINLISFLFLSIFFILNISGDKKKDFLFGSIVKSQNWEIDRARNMEIFTGNVKFRNSDYLLESDKALYNHKTETWDIEGNVYCDKKFEDGTAVETFCDKAIYMDKSREAFMYSQDKQVKTIYYLKDNRKIISLSNKSHAQNESKKIQLEGNLKIFTDSATITGNKGLYEALTGEFTISENRPFVIGENENYNLYLESDIIKLNKETQIIEAINKVKGSIYNKAVYYKEK